MTTTTEGRPTDEQLAALARLLLSLPSPPGDRSDSTGKTPAAGTDGNRRPQLLRHYKELSQ